MPDDFVRVGNDEDNSIIQLNQYADAWTGVVDSGVPLDMYEVNSALKWAGRFRNKSGSGNHVQICNADESILATFTDDDIWLGAAVRLSGLRTVDGISLWDHAHTGLAGMGPKIPTGGIEDHAITSLLLANGVPIFTKRQGNSATAWGTAGTTEYTPTATVQEAGSTRVTLAPGTATDHVHVTFKTAFVGQSGFVCGIGNYTAGGAGEYPYGAWGVYVSATEVEVHVARTLIAGAAYADVHWLATGQVA
jgi:hypothetical protein